MKRNLSKLICLTIALIMCWAIAGAQSYTKSSQHKNKTYQVDLGDKQVAYMRAYGDTAHSSTSLKQSSSTRSKVTATVNVAEIRYATNTRLQFKTASNTFTGEGGVITGDINRAYGDTNMKYVHTANITSYSTGAVLDTYQYTAWQNY